jgi:hypothetical protein
VQHTTPDLAWVLAIEPGINYQYSNSELDTESNKPRIKYTKVIIGCNSRPMFNSYKAHVFL